MRVLIIFTIFLSLLFGAEDEKKNIWLKTYSNYKNYNIIITNITKLEKRLQVEKDISEIEQLNQKLNIHKSKLGLYEKNNNFDEILREFKFEVPEITLYDFLFDKSKKTIDKHIEKFLNLKTQFNLAKSILNDSYQSADNQLNKQKAKQLKNDMDYFLEYSENIDKTYKNILDQKDELEKKYQEYKDEVFTKHILTFGIIVSSYIVYKLLLFLIFHFTQNRENYEEQQNYKKLLSLLFAIFVLIFIVVRYIDDFIYIITFLGVIAAALTIALKEIVLNIAGAIYIFFSNVIRVGNRVMVQFETKHTIGDIVDISLVKIKLHEVDDYSNIKELKSVGRTIYIPNSYIFTKVFYNYSLKKNGLINDLIEFDFDIKNEFKKIEEITQKVFNNFELEHSITYNLNSSKTSISAIISYKVNYKKVSKLKGEILITLMQEYEKNEIVLKSSKKVSKSGEESE